MVINCGYFIIKTQEEKRKEKEYQLSLPFSINNIEINCFSFHS